MFAVLYSHAVSQLNADPDDTATRPREPAAALEWQGGQKLKSLETVLTPEQLETYRRMQETQAGYVRDALSRTASGAKP